MLLFLLIYTFSKALKLSFVHQYSIPYLSHGKPLIYIYIQKHICCKLSSKTWWIVVAMTIILFTFTFIHKYSSYHVCSYLFPYEQRGPFSFLLVIFLHLIDWWCNRSTKVREKKYFVLWKEQVLYSSRLRFLLIELNSMKINLWSGIYSFERL